jgi:hypothetical protein
MFMTSPSSAAVDPHRLADARRQLHHAAQLVVAAGISYLPPAADDSHTALSWSETGLLLGKGASPDLRFALRIADLTLQVVDPAGNSVEFGLTGRMVADAYAWMRAQLAERGFDPRRLTSKKHYEIPPHAVAEGAPFDATADALAVLRYWYALGSRVARGALDASGTPGTVQVWPHHFDIAGLTVLPGEPRRTIGVGMTPGDEWYEEPYVYVGPYPYPRYGTLPDLPHGGHWHTHSWFGAVLTASAVADIPFKQRAEAVVAFASGARQRCVELMAS